MFICFSTYWDILRLTDKDKGFLTDKQNLCKKLSVFPLFLLFTFRFSLYLSTLLCIFTPYFIYVRAKAKIRQKMYRSIFSIVLRYNQRRTAVYVFFDCGTFL